MMKKPYDENWKEGPEEEEFDDELWDDGYFIDEDEEFEATGQDGWRADGLEVKAEYFPDETWTEEDWQLFFADDEAEEPPPRIPRWISNVLAIMLLIAFIGICFPFFSRMDFGTWDFLSDNLSLRQEPMVQQSLPAILSITASADNSAVPVRNGTGFFVSADGWLLSNAHITGEAEHLRVETDSGKLYFTNEYIQLGNYDIAAIKVNAEDCHFIVINTGDVPEVAEELTIVGNPLGFMRVATRGPVLDHYSWSDRGDWVFELDARIRSGSSGSPVLNSAGEAVGVIYATRFVNTEGQTRDTALAVPLAAVEAELRELGILSDQSH